MPGQQHYPLYQMKIDGELRWCSLPSAGEWYDCGHIKVEIGAFVLEAEGAHPRAMTAEDRDKIVKAADDYSASK